MQQYLLMEESFVYMTEQNYEKYDCIEKGYTIYDTVLHRPIRSSHPCDNITCTPDLYKIGSDFFSICVLELFTWVTPAKIIEEGKSKATQQRHKK